MIVGTCNMPQSEYRVWLKGLKSGASITVKAVNMCDERMRTVTKYNIYSDGKHIYTYNKEKGLLESV